MRPTYPVSTENKWEEYGQSGQLKDFQWDLSIRIVSHNPDNTAKTLSENFGNILQNRQSKTLGSTETSTTVSTQLD